MTCKDCAHHNACHTAELDSGVKPKENICGFFKPKKSENSVTLPCKIGDTIYNVVGQDVRTGVVKSFTIEEDTIWILVKHEVGFDCSHNAKSIGKYIFLTDAEAKEAAKNG